MLVGIYSGIMTELDRIMKPNIFNSNRKAVSLGAENKPPNFVRAKEKRENRSITAIRKTKHEAKNNLSSCGEFKVTLPPKRFISLNKAMNPTKSESPGMSGGGMSTIEAMPPDFAQICAKLNLDNQQRAASWLSYDKVTKQCTLEGNQMCWYASSIYLSCWQLGIQEECRMVSIQNILQECDLSILDLIDRIVKWSNMASNDRRVQEHVQKLRSYFAVTAVLFKKYMPIIYACFNENAKKNEKQVCFKSVVKLTWMLFITIKAEYGNLGDDLLACYHLLLCCCELICADLHTTYPNSLFLTNDFKSLQWERENIALDTLCCRFHGVQLDAKHFKVHWFTPRLRRLFEEAPLLGNSELGTGLVKHMEKNLLALSKLYSTSIIVRGYVDERMLLPEQSWSQIKSCDPLAKLRQKVKSGVEIESDSELMVRLTLQSCLERITSYRQPTPLSGKSYVISGDQFCPVTPISAARMASDKLNELVQDLPSVPKGTFRLFLSKISCLETVETTVESLGERFVEACKNEAQDFDTAITELKIAHKEKVQILFYRLLSAIITSEQKRDSVEWHAVISRNSFHKILYTCALELVLFAYNSKREFPWAAEILDVTCVDFYKVIELVIRTESELSRDMVKHLNTIEERVLEELAWVRTSPLWENIGKYGVPACSTVMETKDSTQQNIDRFNSPVKQMPTKRKLNFTESGTESPGKMMTVTVAGGALATIRLPPKNNISDKESAEVDTQHRTIPAHANLPVQQNFSNSLNLFFKKVYYVLSVRLLDLCDRLRMSDMSRRKTWTLLEQTLRTEPRIMRGRHIDQILLCCVYVTAKVTNNSIPFQDIMYQYRMQPQAHSRVYRRVLLETSVSPHNFPSQDEQSRDSTDSQDSTGHGKLRSASCLPIPGLTSAPPSPEPKEDHYADLITFYNIVFVSKCSEFAHKLSPLTPLGVPLSPIPVVRNHMLSPRKHVGGGVFVSSMMQPTIPISPARPFKYNFNRSPYKDLRAINSMLRHSEGRQPLVGTKKPSHITLPSASRNVN